MKVAVLYGYFCKNPAVETDVHYYPALTALAWFDIRFPSDLTFYNNCTVLFDFGLCLLRSENLKKLCCTDYVRETIWKVCVHVYSHYTQTAYAQTYYNFSIAQNVDFELKIHL